MGSYQICSLVFSLQRERFYDMDHQHTGIPRQLHQDLYREVGAIPCTPLAYHACRHVRLAGIVGVLLYKK